MESLTKKKKNMTDEEAQVLLSELLDRSYFKDGQRVLAPGNWLKNLKCRNEISGDDGHRLS